MAYWEIEKLTRQMIIFHFTIFILQCKCELNIKLEIWVTVEDYEKDANMNGTNLALNLQTRELFKELSDERFSVAGKSPTQLI